MAQLHYIYRKCEQQTDNICWSTKGVMEKLVIREAKPEDCSQIAALIAELAQYEHLEDKIVIGEKELREDGFGEKKYFFCLVAEVEHPKKGEFLIGYCMYFNVYSTFEGKSMYMEDLYVKPEFRSRGVGTKLFKRVAQIASRGGCKRLDFAVLSWNTPTIGFYKRLGARDITEKSSWHMFRLDRVKLEKLCA